MGRDVEQLAGWMDVDDMLGYSRPYVPARTRTHCHYRCRIHCSVCEQEGLRGPVRTDEVADVELQGRLM